MQVSDRDIIPVDQWDIEATAEVIARKLSTMKGGRLHAVAYEYTKAGAREALIAAANVSAALSVAEPVAEIIAQRDALIAAGLKCCDGTPNPNLRPFDLAMSFIDSTNTARKAADMLWQEYKAELDTLRALYAEPAKTDKEQDLEDLHRLSAMIGKQFRPHEPSSEPVKTAPAVVVKVKPLEWIKSYVTGWNDDWHTISPFIYTIRCADENGWEWCGCGAVGYESSPEAAKAAAQADYEARIRSALSAQVQDVAVPAGYLKPDFPDAIEPRYIPSGERVHEWQKQVFTIPVYTAPFVAVPTGWKLVPMEPTEEMKRADPGTCTGHTPTWIAALYRAMIAASPTPPAEKEGGE